MHLLLENVKPVKTRQRVRTLALALLLMAACRPVDPSTSDASHFKTLMTRLADAWSTQDTEAALDCFTDDALYMQPPDKQLYRGRDELRKLFEALRPGTFMRFHHLAFDATSQSGFGEFSFGYEDTETADHGVVVVRLREGRIASWREYFEKGPAAFEDFIDPEGGKTWEWTADDLQ